MDLYDIPIQTYNLGTGHGWSNIDIIKSFGRFTGREVEYVIGPDRPGDPDLLIAGASKFVDTTGYRYNHSNIENIITSAWNYYSNN
jgi:UDP-glucose 4-epimerase